VALGAERGVPRHTLHYPLPDTVLDVCHSHSLFGHVGARTMALAVQPEPDIRCGAGLQVGAVRAGGLFATIFSALHGGGDLTLYRRVGVLQAYGGFVCRYCISHYWQLGISNYPERRVMSDVAIRVEHLSKRYKLGEREPYKSLREVLVKATQAPFKRSNGNTKEDPGYIWALDDVSFEIKHGEAVGIIGRNGAGKSTLLKVLSRITKPTKGKAKIYGRVGSLLEVGTGFHPELTGRENIYLNGAILGMKRQEIQRKFDEIVDFAEIEIFLDTPVKRYSSGMYVRLAFAVAAHLEPEILLVDEVLAVGDAKFQEKCLGKMNDVTRNGRSVLFVSHSMASIASLCDTTILLDSGKVKLSDQTEKVINTYLSRISSLTGKIDLRASASHHGSGEVRIVEAVIRDASGKPCTNFRFGEDICFEFVLESLTPSRELISVVWIQTITGIPVLHLASHDDPSQTRFQINNRVHIKCVLPNCQLYPGIYSVSLWIGSDHNHDIDFVTDAIQFQMEQGELLKRGFDMSWRIGIFHTPSTWRIDEE
jgi:lipopolysaccharide transport system ATP-binding protein